MPISPSTSPAFPITAASDKNCYFVSRLPHFSGAASTGFSLVFQPGNLLAARRLRAPQYPFTGERFAWIELLYFEQLVSGLRFLRYFSGRTAILEFFSSGKVAELAKSLAQDLARRYPPAIANNPAQVVSQQRLYGILEQVFARTTDFGPENRLGWYQRFSLGRSFRDELGELGYDGKFIDLAAEGLTLRVRVRRDPSL